MEVSQDPRSCPIWKGFSGISFKIANTMRELPDLLRAEDKSMSGQWRTTPSGVLDMTRPCYAPWSGIDPVGIGVLCQVGVDVMAMGADFYNPRW